VQQTLAQTLYASPASEFPVPWKQGEHVAVVGDTGTGKTTLLTTLVPARSHVVVFRTKPDQSDEPKWGRSFHHIKKASDIHDARHDRFILTPKYESIGREGYALLERAYKDGGWCIVLDELLVVERLGLTTMVDKLLTQGRSQRVTMVLGMQRPVGVSRFALSQCTHVFSFRVEGRDLKTMRDAFTVKLVPLIDADSPSAIAHHDFAYFNRSRRVVTVGNAQNISRVISLRETP